MTAMNNANEIVMTEQVERCPHGYPSELCRLCMRAEIERLQRELAAWTGQTPSAWLIEYSPDSDDEWLQEIVDDEDAARRFAEAEPTAVVAGLVRVPRGQEVITAQHGETGRMWSGARPLLPAGYHEVAASKPPPASEPGPQPPATDVAPIAKLTVRDGLIQRADVYAPGLPDGEHDLFPVPVESGLGEGE
jgi:hypothetical protein